MMDVVNPRRDVERQRASSLKRSQKKPAGGRRRQDQDRSREKEEEENEENEKNSHIIKNRWMNP